MIQNGGDMLSYSPHRYRCCQHNVSWGWPYYAEHLWMATPDNGLSPVLYAASEVTAKVGDYKPVEIDPDAEQPETAPLMPTNISIKWFNDRQQMTSRIRLKLSQMTTREIWDTEVCNFEENLPEEILDDQIVQVDRGVQDEDFDKKKGDDK